MERRIHDEEVGLQWREGAAIVGIHHSTVQYNTVKGDAMRCDMV